MRYNNERDSHYEELYLIQKVFLWYLLETLLTGVDTIHVGPLVLGDRSSTWP